MAAKRFWCSTLVLLILALTAGAAVVDKCTLDPTGIPAIDLISGYQSHLINLFALDTNTKVEVLPATETTPNKNMRIVYRVGEPNAAVFYIGVEYREADGKTEIEDYYQSQNLTKVSAFFELDVQEKPIVCNNFQQDFATFADRYFAAISPSLTQKSIGTIPVSVSLAQSDSNDVAQRGFKFVTASALKGNSQTVGTITGSGVVGGQSSVVVTGKPPSVGSASGTDIIQIQSSNIATVASAATPTPVASTEQSIKVAQKQTASNIAPLVIEQGDKVLIDYISNNFRLAYNFRIFRSKITDNSASIPTLSAQPRRRLRRSRRQSYEEAN